MLNCERRNCIGYSGYDASPPRVKDEDALMRAMVNYLIKTRYELADETEKPILKVLMNYDELYSLLSSSVKWVQDGLDNNEPQRARQRAILFIETVEPIIETLRSFHFDNGIFDPTVDPLETFFNEAMKGAMNHVSE